MQFEIVINKDYDLGSFFYFLHFHVEKNLDKLVKNNKNSTYDKK